MYRIPGFSAQQEEPGESMGRNERNEKAEVEGVLQASSISETDAGVTK